MSTPTPGRVVVVGAGMVAHRFVSQMIARSPEGEWRVSVVGDEDRAPYDRVHLSEFFGGRSADDLTMDPTVWEDPRTELVTGDAVAAVDREAQTVTTRSGRVLAYDHLVLATGSWAWTPRTEGTDLPGVFSYRTMADVQALREYVELRTERLGRTLHGVVVGGGVLGLEAAAALQGLGTSATVVEFADRLMSVQLDDAARARDRPRHRRADVDRRDGTHGGGRRRRGDHGPLGRVAHPGRRRDLLDGHPSAGPRGARGRSGDRRARRRRRGCGVPHVGPGRVGRGRVRVVRGPVRGPGRTGQRHGRRRGRPSPGRQRHLFPGSRGDQAQGRRHRGCELR